MLVEMFSPVFMDQGEIRPPIRFKKGLNVVLGKEDGANSIGKSSAMLAIDFVFGGDTYLKSDGVKHIGHHTIFFAFQFCGQKHYFARATEDADTLTEQADQGHTEEEIEKGKEKAQLDAQRLMLETELQSKQRKLKLVTMSLEYGLYPTEADLSALQEFFPGVNLRKLYEVERYHQKLAQILDEQFSTEQQSIEGEIDSLKQQLAEVRTHISTLGFIGNISKEFLDKHAEIKGKIDALKVQNEAFLTLKGLQDAKARADEILKKAIESILLEIETELNDKMREFDGQLHSEPRKPPYLRFDSYNRYKFETPDDTGTGANFRSMIIYDLAVLFTTALPAIAHDSLILKNISDGAIDGIMKIYEKSEKQIFIAFDKQAAYTVDTQTILERNCVLRLSDGNCELYGRPWNKEE